jgi:hypothetical protein
MSGYTSGNNAPTQMAQAPNRRGNISKHPAEHKGGVTAVTRPQGNTSYSGPHQGAASAGGSITGRHQKVAVSRPECYNTKSTNTGYIARDGKSWLK